MCQDDVKIWNTRVNLNNILLVLELRLSNDCTSKL